MAGPYRCVQSIEELDELCLALSCVDRFAFDTETTGLDPIECDIVGFSASLEDPNEQVHSFYVPVGHNTAEDQIDGNLALEMIKPVLENPEIAKVFHNYAFDGTLLAQYDIHPVNIDDTLFMSYAKRPGPSGHSMDDLVEHLYGKRPIGFGEVVPNHELLPFIRNFADVRLDHATRYAAEDTEDTLRMFYDLRHELKKKKLWHIYDVIDRPLIPVICEMKINGIEIDVEKCDQLTEDWSGLIAEAEETVHEYDETVNIGSTKDLQRFFFTDLDLDPVKFTDKGGESTDAEALEILAGYADHLEPNPVAAVRDFRKFSKLVGTYSEALPGHIKPRTGRVHPNFNPCVMVTPRISSSGPNAQNIPKKGEQGAELRSVFVAREGCKFVVSDLSQIEYRVLAQISRDPVLIKAFMEGLDFHSLTASRVAGWDYEEFVTALEQDGQVDEKTGIRRPLHIYHKKVDDLRRDAKVINFGIIYGMTSFGLAKQIKKSQDEAQDMIDAYFEQFLGVAEWIRDIQEQGKKTRCVETLYGRKMYLTAFGDAAGRQASNYPIQGTAADFMRMCMENTRYWLTKKEFDADILAQIHDELIVEVPEDQAEDARWVVQRAMETADGGWIDWQVPIIAEAKIGNNWNEAK